MNDPRPTLESCSRHRFLPWYFPHLYLVLLRIKITYQENIQTSPPTCHAQINPEIQEIIKQNKMSCQRCPQLRVELQRTQNNVRLIEDLLEDARNRDKNLQDTLDRLAMLHKHCRTNYQDMANLNFALNHCQHQPRCPRL